jgi:hypothetical protein
MSTMEVIYHSFTSGKLRSSISETALARFFSEVAHMDTIAPRGSKYFASARPRPRLAPVTAMTFPAKGWVLTAYSCWLVVPRGTECGDLVFKQDK